ncbi:MAG: DinB family protein [Vicingaceae bacterium]
MKQSVLIKSLEAYVKAHRAFAESLINIDEQKLNQQPADGGWNVLQCIEHLNRYGDFYLKEVGGKVKKATNFSNDQNFKAGFFGKLFTSMMLPKKGMIKMKTFADKNPDAKILDLNVIHKFIKQQKEWEEILKKCQLLNLNKNKCSLTLPLLKMNMGSTLQFVIYHNERHVVQAQRLL